MVLAQSLSHSWSQDVVRSCSHLPDGLTGAEGSVSWMAHSHGYWQEASVPLYKGPSMGFWSVFII